MIFTTITKDDMLYMLKTGKKWNLDVISGFKYLTPKEYLMLEAYFSQYLLVKKVDLVFPSESGYLFLESYQVFPH